MQALTERAVDAADVCLFLIDARAGVTPLDRALAEVLRKRAARVILVANKAEGRAADAGLIEAFELGLGEPVAISAEHGLGMDELLRALEPVAAEFPDAAEVVEVEEEIDDSVDEAGEGAALPAGRPIQIAVMGRPNSGKSDARQCDPRRGPAADRAGGRADPRRDRGAGGLAGRAVPRLRHRRDAQEGEGAGQAREALGVRRACARSSSPRWSWC